jgi:putative ABC transport system permease protein
MSKELSMLEILKNMFRRKGRTLLTVFGIAIGIFALVVMGAISEKLNRLVDGGTKYYQDKVVVSSEGGTFSLTPVVITKKAEIEKVPGVKAVFGETYVTLSKDLSAVSFGPPASIVGMEPGSESYESFKLVISKGRDLKPEDRGKVVLGSDLVKKLNAKVGQNVKLRGKDFEVIGIYEKTFTSPDSEAFVPFKDGQEFMYEDQPPIIKANVKPEQLVYGFVVYPKPGENPDDLAKTIKAQVSGVSALGPKAFADQIASTVRVFTSIIYGIGVISLLVGTLSIVNTMTMSISERTKEIGIKKALGAKNRNILAEYLTEAGVIGFLGGIIGLLMGFALVSVVNPIVEKTGDKIFLLTPRLLLGSLAFSVVVGIVAGIYPAYYAVKISIVKSLREE